MGQKGEKQEYWDKVLYFTWSDIVLSDTYWWVKDLLYILNTLKKIHKLRSIGFNPTVEWSKHMKTPQSKNTARGKTKQHKLQMDKR